MCVKLFVSHIYKNSYQEHSRNYVQDVPVNTEFDQVAVIVNSIKYTFYKILLIEKLNTHLGSAVMTNGRIEFVFTHHGPGNTGIHFAISIILQKQTQKRRISRYFFN